MTYENDGTDDPDEVLAGVRETTEIGKQRIRDRDDELDVIAQTIAHVRRWNAGEFMSGHPSDDDYNMAKAIQRAIATGEAQKPGQ